MRRFLISTPYLWLQCCFFQPLKFKQDFESKLLSQRLVVMLRLMPLLFLYAYTPALVIRIIIYALRPDLYSNYGVLMPLNPMVAWFLFDATWAAALSCLIAGLVGGLFSTRLGIALALALSLANGIIVHTGDDTFLGIIFGVAIGLIVGITFNSSHALKQEGSARIIRASTIGISVGLIVGFFTGTIGGYWAGFVLGKLYPVFQDENNIGSSIAGLTVGGLSGCLIAALLGLIASRIINCRHPAWGAGIPIHVGLSTVGTLPGGQVSPFMAGPTLSIVTRIAMVVAAAFGVAVGIPTGNVGGTQDTLINGIIAGIMGEFIVVVPFLLFYLLSYYRLPLYPFSAYSTIQAYLVSRSKLQPALYCLRNSSLHWDECVFLPLPYLKSLLLLASEQNVDDTLNEINFILQQRPQQRRAAQATVYELALRDLEQRTILRDIGLAHQRLAVLIPRQVWTLSSSAKKVFRHLNDASREAASYLVQTNKKDRQEALERMIRCLKQIHANTAFRSIELNQHLRSVVNQWSMLAEQGKETLGSISASLYIDNPYAPGNPLELGNPLFVGRVDVVQKLAQALQKKPRPTFLLTGERRMGKSSILKQLPVLLGPHFLPVFCDLQTTGILASTAAFFAAIAAGIEKQLEERGMFVHKLERGQLNAAQQQSEVMVYDLFEQWFVEVEQTLQRAECVIILEFDEFEKLEDAEERENLNLKLLFDWFRSIIQNRSTLALLFSGAKMVGDMGRSWAGYFVNVERIKVSFLRDRDALDLIMHPVPQVFTAEVAQEIMRLTRGQPFLVQAVCKQIIELLNDNSREQATLQDVSSAIKEVFEAWPGYFWDLWNRCDPDQRACLPPLLSLKGVDAGYVVQRSGLSKQRTMHALEKLQIRDIVTYEQNIYRFAVPVFAQWVEQHLHLLLPVDEH